MTTNESAIAETNNTLDESQLNETYAVDLKSKGAKGDGLSDDSKYVSDELNKGYRIFNGGIYAVFDRTIIHSLKFTSGNAYLMYKGIKYPFGNIVNQHIELNVPDVFYNIQHCFEWLDGKRIIGDSSVTIKIADGVYQQSWVNTVNHVDGNNIYIRGNEADRSKCIIEFDNLNNRDCFLISNKCSLGWLNGITIKGMKGWLSEGAWATQCYGSGIRAIDGSSIVCGTEIEIDKMYYGMRSMHGATISAIGKSADNIKGGGVRVTNAGDVGFHAHAATIYCNCAEASNVGHKAEGLGFGFCAEAGGYIVCEYACATNNIKAGFYALSQGTVWAHGVNSSNNLYGVLAWGGTVECNSLGKYQTILNNNLTAGIRATYGGLVGANSAKVISNTMGILADENGIIDVTAVQSNDNAQHGFSAISGGYITGNSAVSERNNINGFNAEDGGIIKSIDSSANDNGSYGYFAKNHSKIFCKGFGGMRNTLFCSPLQNSITELAGNNSSFIIDV